MKLKYAACIVILLSFTCLHADEVEKQIIGTWLVRDNSPVKKYITYHPPRRTTNPTKFRIRGFREYCSRDVLYGRYDVVMDIPGLSHKVIGISGVWFFPRDSEEKLILDYGCKDADPDNIKPRPNECICPPDGFLATTRILKADDKEFIYEEYNPESKVFDRNNAVRVPVQSLEQIKQLPYHDEI
ncbi:MULTISPECIES: hypothetical protein [unclassified Endozoicomonas]|uniref:hypothetical protein n=2 Tax=Endozoicomonas TaxID=305899 RepID=UPI002148E39A|nr:MULTISPECIES: hypothetical protein [unclassified Endozoicomonas]